MGYRAQNLYEQPFTSQQRIVVEHNLDIEYPGIRLLINGEIRPDLILATAPDVDNPTNRLVVSLKSIQTGLIQITNFDIQPLGIQSATLLALTGFGVKLVFGDEYTYVEDRPPANTTSTTFVQRLRLTTPNVPLGTYRIATSFLWDYTSTSTSFRARLELDDTDQVWFMRREPKSSSGTQRLRGKGKAHVQLAAGVHTFDLDYAAEGTNTAQIREARLIFWRI